MYAEPSSGVSMRSLAEALLPDRTSEYIHGLCDKLLGEGLVAPADLLRTSKEALENKLSTHAAFNVIEMADALSLVNAAEGASGRAPTLPSQRSRSPRRDNGGKKSRRGRDAGSRRRSGRPPVKPALWAAVERGDHNLVRQLLADGKDPEEKFQGWTPLMKAAEEDHDAILSTLIRSSASLEATNHKGRSALSLAAAPSSKRNTATKALRALLAAGADTSRTDVEGMTAEARAAREKHEDAVVIITESRRA